MRKQKYSKNRQGVWEYMRSNAEFGLKEISRATGLDIGSVKTFMKSLEAGGFIRCDRVDIDNGNKRICRLVRDGGRYAPNLNKDGTRREPTGRERMWYAIKALGRFNYLDLSLAAETSNLDARFFCRALKHAGYIRVLTKGKPGIPDVYLFCRSRDTGPLAPQIRKDKSVFDTNTQKVVWKPAVKSEVHHEQ